MCKILRFLLMVLPILLSACGTSKKVVNGKLDAKLLTAEQVVAAVEKNVISDECLTAKMNFRFKSGSQNLSVGGNLKMKRNDVIQLSLVALGLMEAVRIEFTPEDALVIDRINKQYFCQQGRVDYPWSILQVGMPQLFARTLVLSSSS